METFSKKEKEKARQKKRKDKEEKREERKANAQKGQALDLMMAYVDENGNITSTPPDPRKKRVIDQEDIQIGVSRQEAVEAQDVVRQGIVTFFNASKGYGFIRDLQTQESIFVHMNGLVDAVGEQDKVTFEVTRTPKGLNAVDVKKVV
ncbi:cold-shock protein [Spirosoma spitsbergense]|uniref:cold-shock protein n=1 Tax=Spirosoma spitsbergense TaxID=431554 RepID=UPI00035EAF7E|nr:cold shock domain-containing protein [Spirosoma spitsbergense]